MPIVTTLQGIFGRVLRIEPRDIDVETPFLELGADSLTLAEALRGIHQAYGVKLTIRQLFEQLPSISALAGFLATTLPSPALFSRPLPPPTPGEAGVVSVGKLASGSAVERILAMQIQAFNQLVAQQLQILGARAAASRSPVPAGSGGEALGFWDRQGKPAMAPMTVSVPLTEAQGDLYTVALAGNEAIGAYYESGVLELRGPLDLGLLRRTMQGEVDRHEALRTVFPDFLRMGEAQEVQEVLPALRLEIPLIDATGAAGCPPERREEIAGRWLEELAGEPFDLARGPLIRASVMRLGERHHLLSVAVHHLVADGLSIGIVLSEVFTAYEAARAGCRPVLPRPMQFREYAAWLAEAWTAERRAADEAYWLDELAGELPVFEPPTDRPRPTVFTFRGRRQRIVLAGADRERILRFGRRHGATLFMTLLAACTSLLHRWTGQDDLITGSAQARRPLAGGDRLVGHCTDIVPLRSRLEDLDAEPTFLRHLAAVRGRVLGAHDHGELSFSRLVRRLAVRRDPSRSPLVNVVFNQDPEWALGAAGGLEITERSPAIPYVKFDLAVRAVPAGEGLVIYLDSSRDLFDAVTIERLAGRLVALLEGAMAFPERPLGELPWMTAADRAQLVAEALVPYPRERTVHQLFAAVAAERPDAVAVEAGDRCLTYAELDVLASGWAHRLRSLGVGTETRVATVLERSPELIIAWLAALKAGGAYVPLDPGFPEERLARLLAGSGAVAVLTVEEHREILERISPVPVFALPPCWSPSSPGEGGGEGAGEEGRGDEGLGWGNSEAKALPDSLAYVTYTSGSTGEPKGVAIPHRAVVRLVRETDYAPLGPDDRVAHLAHVAFDATTFEIWGPLLNGGRVVVLDRDTAGAPHRLAAALREHEVTALFLTTALFNQMAAEEPAAFAGLRCLLTGGEAADSNRFRAILAAGGPDRLANIYGPTETTTFALWEPVEELPEGAVSIPIGRPIANTRVCLLHGCEPVPPGVDGELCLGGDGLARGYLGRPDLTAERFVPDPLATTPGARLYRTGDRARMRLDGRVEHLGRLDRQVKIRGFRVELGEVEAALAQAPGVRECAVVAREDEAGGRSLVAWVALEEGVAPDLRGFLHRRLPEAMIPAAFGTLDAFPHTASGKVDRRALALLEPSTVAADAGASFEAPRTPVEEIVAGAWRTVLGRERVGRRDDFFDLGGHSLLASRVLSRLRGLLGVDLPLRDFFHEPTVAGLARLANEARQKQHGAGPPPLVHVTGGGWARLSFAQERLWLVDQLQPGSTAYNMALPLVLTGRLNVLALGQALEEIARRHEVLRTRFVAAKDGPVQVVEPVSWLGLNPLGRVDLSGLSLEIARAELSRLGGLRQPFDLAHGPLFRAILVRLAESEHTLVVDMHHAVYDGWSIDVMTRELSALYGAFAAGRPSPLPELPIQYADFARWQRQWLQGDVVEAELAWWRGQLGENPPPLALPTDRPRPVQPPADGFRSESQVLFLSPELAGGLAALARGRGATLFIVLLAGFQTLLHRHTRQPKIAVGSPVAGRTRLEVEELIGLFVNTLVLAADFADFNGEPTVSALLDRVRDATLGAFDHQDLPFEQLVAALARDRDPSRQPLFQVMFVLQNNAQSEIDLPGLNLSVLPASSGGALFDLTLSAIETEEGIACGVTYAAELFDPATIVRLLEQYRRLLETWVDDPGQLVDRSPLFSGAEQRQIERRDETLAENSDAAEETLAEARRAELERRRAEVASRRGQLSGDRRALLRKWVGGGGAVPAGREEAPPEVSPLVELQTGGSRPPIFLVHAAGGLVHDFVNLAHRLDPDQPLYALQSPGLAGGEHFATVPEMAARYLEAVRCVQPRGPYRLGGYCVGGTVAFEMARQLRAAGEEIDSLLLFESPGPPSEPPPPLNEAELLATYARSYGNGTQVSPDDLRALPPEAWIDYVLERVRDTGGLDASFNAAQLYRRWEVMKRNTRAILPFVPAGPLPLGAILFRAVDQPDAFQGQPFLGWERWLEGSIEVVGVEGGHLDVFQEPAVTAVARELRDRTAVGAAV